MKLKISEDRRQKGLFMILSSLFSGILYFVLIAKYHKEQTAFLIHGETFFVVYQIFVALFSLSGIAFGVWIFCGNAESFFASSAKQGRNIQ